MCPLSTGQCYTKLVMTHATTGTVTEAVYQSEGKPALTKKVDFHPGRQCGVCRQRRTCAAADAVLTWKFGSWDDVLPDSTGRRWLCAACAHAFRAAPYRRQISLVQRDANRAGVVSWPTRQEVRDVLSRSLSPDAALVVPIGGKRVVLPRARWGQVATDATVFVWQARHQLLMRAGAALLALGVPTSALGAESPPFNLLCGRDGESLLRHWREFAPARTDKVMLPLYQRILGSGPEARR